VCPESEPADVSGREKVLGREEVSGRQIPHAKGKKG